MLFYQRAIDRVLSQISTFYELRKQREARERYLKRKAEQREESLIGSLFDSWSMPTFPP